MPNIKSMSSLRNYTSVLDEVAAGNPVFLTREGKGKYAILDLEEYDSLRASLWENLFNELDDSRNEAQRDGWISETDMRSRYSGNA